MKHEIKLSWPNGTHKNDIIITLNSHTKKKKKKLYMDSSVVIFTRHPHDKRMFSSVWCRMLSYNYVYADNPIRLVLPEDDSSDCAT